MAQPLIPTKSSMTSRHPIPPQLMQGVCRLRAASKCPICSSRRLVSLYRIDASFLFCLLLPHTNTTQYFTPMLSRSPQCFFARLGFVQPPSCLKCAYRSSGCGDTNKHGKNNANKAGSSSSCHELVAWRRDANIALHPDKLDGNILFITCDTAKSLVEGDAYPSIRWDTRNRRLLHEI